MQQNTGDRNGQETTGAEVPEVDDFDDDDQDDEEEDKEEKNKNELSVVQQLASGQEVAPSEEGKVIGTNHLLSTDVHIFVHFFVHSTRPISQLAIWLVHLRPTTTSTSPRLSLRCTKPPWRGTE